MAPGAGLVALGEPDGLASGGCADWDAVALKAPSSVGLDVRDGVPAAVCEPVGAREADAADGVADRRRVTEAVGVAENVMNARIVFDAEGDAGTLAGSVALYDGGIVLEAAADAAAALLADGGGELAAGAVALADAALLADGGGELAAEAVALTDAALLADRGGELAAEAVALADAALLAGGEGDLVALPLAVIDGERDRDCDGD
jgi:hypothetical protein